MAKKLKKIPLADGRILEEVGCGNYICRYCGARATQGNYVTGLCLQLRAPHVGLCGAYVENETKRGYITDCTTCKYFEGTRCTWDKEDPLA